MGREADIERCCIAYRPASVRGVITRVETPHNTERQSEEGVSNRQKRGANGEKHIDADKKTV